MAQVWLVTGVSSGLGFEIGLKALESGFTVIGTVRSRERAAKEVEKIESQGGKCLELDVTDADACFDVFEKAEKLHGHIDVLVNNAGMSYLGAVEDFSDKEAKAQLEVNFHGPLRLIRAALPGFRKRKTGAVVNVTSVAGVDGQASCGLYAASKFAVEGLSEALARELAEYNTQVLLVEPGAFRTNFLAAYKTPIAAGVQHYSATKAVMEKFGEYEGKQPGDPTKAAARVVEAVAGTGMAGKLKDQVLRLPLGPDCVRRYEAKIKLLNDDLEAARSVAMSTDI